MRKSSKLVVGIIVILAVIIAVAAYFNRENVADKKALIENAEFIVYDNGQEVVRYDMQEISEMGETTFKANLKTSGKAPIPYEYTGVLLKNILVEAGISLEGKSSVIVSAADGYVVAVDIDKVLDENNVYLAYRREGELIGTKESGGKGPYQMIISKDQFSQHWCKYAISAEVK